jgi:hypothetical protein
VALEGKEVTLAKKRLFIIDECKLYIKAVWMAKENME